MKKRNVTTLSDERLLEVISKACKAFEGDATVLESAIGCLCWGRIVGWRGIRVMHSSRTLKRYEETLGIEFREVIQDRTSQSRRMKGVQIAEDVGKFWQAITAGMVPAQEGKIAAKVPAT